MPKTRDTRSRTAGPIGARHQARAQSGRPAPECLTTPRSGGRRAEIPHQACDEPGTILPFECDLLVVKDDGLHERLKWYFSPSEFDCGLCTVVSTRYSIRRRVSADDRTLDRSGQTGVGPVARQVEAFDERPRARSHRLTWRK